MGYSSFSQITYAYAIAYIRIPYNKLSTYPKVQDDIEKLTVT
jgi:hypothetical protein